MNPIGLIITAIAVGAYLIYKNWGSIGPWFLEKWNAIKTGAANAWQEIKTGFSSGILGISSTILNWSPLGLFYRAFAAVLSWFGIELPQKFTGFGGMLIDGLINGIKAGFNKLKSVWSEVTNYIPSYFKQEQKIRSPSRVMAALGGHVMGGLRVGLEQGFPGLKEKFNQVLNVFNPNSHTALDKINVAPALAKINPVQRLSSTNRGDVIVQGDTITIQITAAPGQTIQQLQNMIEGVLNRRDQQKQARVRSSYMDDE